MRKPLPNTLLRMGLAIALSVFASAGEAQPIDEYQVKAAFLFNFAKFVEWPAQTFKSPTDPIAICVLGTNPFGHSLEDAVDGKSVEGRKFSVRQFNDPGQAAGCQILFIAARQKRPLSETALSGRSDDWRIEGICGGRRRDRIQNREAARSGSKLTSWRRSSGKYESAPSFWAWR